MTKEELMTEIASAVSLCNIQSVKTFTLDELRHIMIALNCLPDGAICEICQSARLKVQEMIVGMDAPKEPVITKERTEIAGHPVTITRERH